MKNSEFKLLEQQMEKDRKYYQKVAIIFVIAEFVLGLGLGFAFTWMYLTSVFKSERVDSKNLPTFVVQNLSINDGAIHHKNYAFNDKGEGEFKKLKFFLSFHDRGVL